MSAPAGNPDSSGAPGDGAQTATAPAPPLALLAELTHRCPLQCPYCSNPVALEARSGELDTAAWRDVFLQAARLGVLQVHLSGGEPMARSDLPDLVAAAREYGLYSNLITSAVLITEERIAALAAAGLNHVQISLQGADAGEADRVAGYGGAHERKLAAARLVREAGLPLTLNAVMHRGNLDRLEAVIELALALGARRLEVAHTQYYGWALRNRAALLPTRDQLATATRQVEAARKAHAGRLTIDYVIPDYYARKPKACMSGWGRRFLNVTPSGRVLPCHAAETIADLRFENVRERPLAEIWQSSDAFERFRGTAWMPEPCRSCERREIDWGGCRCQALALTGDAANADPACELSPHHAALQETAARDSAAGAPDFVYRSFANARP